MDLLRKVYHGSPSEVLPGSPLSRLQTYRKRQRFNRPCNVIRMNFGSIVLLTISLMGNVARSSFIPEKYPVEVYHMLQERTQIALGRDNRVAGTWGPWSPWSECSRSCGTGIQSQARECLPFRRLLRKRSIIITENNATNAKPICIGTYRRYHICNTQDCPNFSEDYRTEQCAKYNGRLYKGRRYTWVPFLDAPNSCALNCRAVGERFYATLEPVIMDGTPCDGSKLRGAGGGGGHSAGISTDTMSYLCVAGQCKRVGCNGVVGSGVTVDACGVCGGQGKGCRLFEGIFMEPILPKGHQPVTTFPKGAMALNVSELRYSANFLALRDSNGSYILNGPPSHSPSGTYKAAGTVITYQRGDKSRLESIIATGPLNESLHLEILSVELNPGVLYKYMLPLKVTEGSAAIAPPLLAAGSSDRGNEIPDSSTQVMTLPMSRMFHHKHHTNNTNHHRMHKSIIERRKEEMKHSSTTVTVNDQIQSDVKKKRRKFAWKPVGLSSCSKDCGGGLQNVTIKCIRESNQAVVNERRCRRFEKPPTPPPLRCNDHPCPARWRPEEWSDCSVTCGEGIRTRKIECVQELNSKTTMRVAAGACMQPPDLRTMESCRLSPCYNNSSPDLRSIESQLSVPRWDAGSWGKCSVTCGKGVQSRAVTCITTGPPCSISDKPDAEKVCEFPSCTSKIDHHAPWLYTEWSDKCSAKCGRGIETRQIACSDGSELFCNPKDKPTIERECFGQQTNCNKPSWFVGSWSDCSVSCGSGIQRRDVICITKINDEFSILSTNHCMSIKPDVEQVCRMPPCSADWYISNWSECSTTCGTGVQTRLVKCIQEGLESFDCSEERKPHVHQKCNTEPCKKGQPGVPLRLPKKTNETTECIDKYPKCGLVMKAGLCRIKYYKHSCCGCRNL